MASNQLFSGELWSIFEPRWGEEYCREVSARKRAQLLQLIDYILLYDKITIPTNDFVVLPALAHTLGAQNLNLLLENEILSFQRIDKTFGYAGNGLGLCCYTITNPPDKPPMPFSSPIPLAVEMAADLIRQVSGRELSKQATERIVTSTRTIDIEPQAQQIIKETHRDICDSDALQGRFKLAGLDMQRLPGIGDAEVQTGMKCGETFPESPIDAVLSIATANLECYLSSLANCQDSSTTVPIGYVLASKLDRSVSREVAQGFLELMEITDIPNLGAAISEGQADLTAIVKLRESRNGIQFRSWFHENCRGNPKDTAKAYISLLREIPQSQKTPFRIMRFIITGLAGLIPAVGTVASAIDTFLVDRLFRGASAKFFIEDLRQSTEKQLRRK